MTDPKDNNTEEPTEEAAATTPPAPEETPAPEVEPETETSGPVLATMGNRILAVLIDGLICMAVSIVPMIGTVVAIAYMLTRDALPFLDGQSIGKKALKLRAVNEETNAPLTNNWGPSIIRNVVLYIPFFFIVELIILSQNKDGQRLGDQWAKTKVITVPES